VINNKAYVSIWGAYDENFLLKDSYVVVYDFTNGSIVSIDTDEGTENLLESGGKLFASNYNYGASSTLSVIDPANNTLIDNVELTAGPAGMVEDADGKLWVICVGGWGATNGYLYRINPETLEIEGTITITGATGIDLATTPDKQNILYTVGTSVFSMPISSIEEATQALFDAEEITSLSALNVDPSTGNIWIGDAPSFTAPGKVYVYSSAGSLLTSYEAGIAPTQIVFK
jgi:YVTN family beta-propeller protein